MKRKPEAIHYPPEIYQEAVQIVRDGKRPSTSYLQREMKVGFSFAAHLIERMAQDGIVSEANHLGRRELLKP